MPMLLTKLMGSGMASGLAESFAGDAADSQTATGTNQATAHETSTAIVRYTTVASGTGALLDNGARGDSQYVVNDGANTLSIYPPIGHTINGLSANAAYSLAAGSWAQFDRITNTRWVAASNDAANASFTPSGSGYAESLQSRLRWLVIITDYLSDADRALVRAGTTVNIDTAFSDAHSALPTNGGEIFFPPGKYKLTAKPTITKKVKLTGAGVSHAASNTGCTVILKDAAMTTALITFGADACSIEGIEFEGETGNTGDGITIEAGRCTLKDVAVYSMGQDGIRVGNSSGHNCNLWHMERVFSKSNTRHGIYIHDGGGGAPNVNGGTLVHPDLANNGGDGLNFDNATLNTVNGGAIQSSTLAGVRFTANAKWNNVFGTDIENNGAASDIITTSGGVQNVVISPSVQAANCTLGEPLNRIIIRDLDSLYRGPKFPATQVTSTDVNTLDDYEEGTFTPALAGASTAGTQTYSAQVGYYTKIGNRCFFNLTIVLSAKDGTTSGQLIITGLPFTSFNASSNTSAVSIGSYSSVDFAAGYTQLVGYVSVNNTVIELYECGDNVARAALTDADFGNTTRIEVSGHYRTAT